MDAVDVVVSSAVAASGGADHVAESKLDNFLKGVSGDFRTIEGARDRRVDGLGDEAGAAQQTRFRFR